MIHVGTAGFDYKDWEGAVYPPATQDRLAWLAQYFDCIEMNVSFYRVPTAHAVERWLGSVADKPDFRFTFKLYQGLTHSNEDSALAPYLEAVAVCRDAGKLGAILLQFPFFFENTEESRRRLSWLAQGLAGWPCALEVRHNSWLSPAALDFVHRLNLNLCAIDICSTSTSIPAAPLATGPIGYVRLHGRNAKAWFDRNATAAQKYDYLYSPTELKEWADRVVRIAEKTQNVYVITNNHFGGKAVANAFTLARLLTGSAPRPPDHILQRFPGVA